MRQGNRSVRNGDYGSQDVNHSNMRWLGHITKENREIKFSNVF